MSLQRHVPISMEPSRWYPDFSHPFVRDPAWPSFRETERDPFRDMVPREAAERQLGTMDTEMVRMAQEMKRMFSEMQHLIPVDANPESWRIKENFLLDNPVYHDQTSGNQVFRLQFDVRQFKPEEIHVNTLANQLTVHAKHEEKTEGKSLLREYHRQYILPKGVSPETLVSKLTRDGVLSIEAPLSVGERGKDKLIPIKHE